MVFHLFGSLSEFERGLIKERTIAGLKAARDLGRIGGRPSALTPEDLVAAKALLSNPKITVSEVAKRLNIDPSTLYRYLPGGRSSIKENTVS